MLHYDGLLDPADAGADKKGAPTSTSHQQHVTFLKDHPLDDVDKSGLEKVIYRFHFASSTSVRHLYCNLCKLSNCLNNNTCISIIA